MSFRRWTLQLHLVHLLCEGGVTTQENFCYDFSVWTLLFRGSLSQCNVQWFEKEFRVTSLLRVPGS